MHISRVVLRVSDPERSADFYSRFGGIEIRGAGPDLATLGAPDGGPVLVELRRAARPGTAPRRAAGLFHTALRYPGRAGLGGALRRLATDGQPITGASDHLVSESIYLDDPDGLGIELYRDRPRDEWPEPATGERVRMATLPLDLEPVLAAADAEPDAGGDGVDVGHVHLKVADVEDAVRFWTDEIGMDLMTRFGPDAAFLADEGYHHHIGANTWLSHGAMLEPADGPGLEAVVVASDRSGETRSPDGVAIVLEAE
jgi:catechol 2,3-dioxygenase